MQAEWDCANVGPSSQELAGERHEMGMARGKRAVPAKCCILLPAERCVRESSPCLYLHHLLLVAASGADMEAAGAAEV